MPCRASWGNGGGTWWWKVCAAEAICATCPRIGNFPRLQPSQQRVGLRPPHRRTTILATQPRLTDQPAAPAKMLSTAMAMTPSIRLAACGTRLRAPARGLHVAPGGSRATQLLGVRAHGSVSGSLSGSLDSYDCDEPTAAAAVAAEHMPAGADGEAGVFFGRLLDMIPGSPRARGIVMLNLLVLLVASNWVSVLCRMPRAVSSHRRLPPASRRPRTLASGPCAASRVYPHSLRAPHASSGCTRLMPCRRWWSRRRAPRLTPLSLHSCGLRWRRQP